MTYSIVARDPDTGELGVAVQSHYFSVGIAVPWVEAGVGAVATQAMVEVGYGPRGLELLRGGHSASEALATLVAADDGSEIRQVAIIDAAGGIAVHTGNRCIAAAGHRIGESYSAQGNMLKSDRVWSAAAAGFDEASGDLVARLLAGLDAAEDAGGDLRGRQSAALIVVSGERSAEPWKQVRADVRVDDHSDPLVELRRLLGLRAAVQLNEVIHEAVSADEPDAIQAALERARELMPGNPEVSFWAAVALVNAGRADAATPILEWVYQHGDGWRELLQRLPAAGILTASPEDSEDSEDPARRGG